MAHVKKTLRRQSALPLGSRERLSAGILREIRDGARREAQRHGVSTSFWIAVVLADALGIHKQERY